ncbi:glycoside hydrolase family 43 protein [Parabacteroides sp. FAFU027]|uniref:glycoside hydrolase family 43 protein n=1 Tax=Parabacteroides sp. FAFU027 TaxID=2922715 RepID=UPI001FAEA0B3|nr:glycoside hydrolase family 43 protein [Parabacteroides sp. FAFU027]
MAKKTHLLLLLLATLFLAPLKAEKEVFLFAYFINNGQDGLHLAYSYDGLKWDALNNGNPYLTPTVGKDKLMRDPSILQGPDGTFRMVWTSGWWDRIVGYASSPDLIHWSKQDTLPVMMHEPTAKNAWAPELFYDQKSKTYYIFWASTIPGRFKEIAETNKEKGLNHRLFAVTTKDFKTYSKTFLFFNPDFSAIDGAILKRGKENWMFVKNENPNPPQKNIRLTICKNIKKGFPTKVSEPITGNKYWAEGPTPLEVGEYVYVYFDKYRDHKYGAVRSKDGKSWEDVSDLVTFPKGIRHGTAFKVKESVLKQLLNQ